jgi:RNA polymerase sigma-70 factor, ECF subfamily
MGASPWQSPTGGHPLTGDREALRVAVAEPDPRQLEFDLVDKARLGDREARAALVERYWDRLHRWLSHLTRDRHAAEDLTQEAFLRAFAKIGKLRPESNFAAWLFRIGHNAYVNACRARPRGSAARLASCDPLPEELPDRAAGPPEEAASREALRDLAKAMGRLPAEFRAALLLRVEEGLSFRAIAHVLGLTEETARWRVFKARQKLLTLLPPTPEEGTP